jgi:high affinity sulfate transporter 1
MAYATIAGLPVQVGLYAALIPMLVYVVFGTARTLSFSTTSTIAIMVAAQIAEIAPKGDAATKIAIASTLAFLVGVFLVACAILRLGVVADFISEPVLVGFKAGIGLVIIVDQLPKLLGVHIHATEIFRNIVSIFSQLPHAAVPTLIVGCASLALIAGLERFAPTFPAPLAAVGLGIAATVVLGLPNDGVTLLGKVPAGLPAFALPNFSLAHALWPGALGIALMSFTESIAAGRAFSPMTQPPDPNRELLAAGLANLGGSVFHSMPAGGGTTQTAMNTHAGARSQLAALVTLATIAATLLFLSPLLALIPVATLAAVIIAATVPIISVRDFRSILAFRRMEFWWSIAAFLGVMLLGTLKGVLVAVALSIATLVNSANHPPLYALGRKPGTDVFRPLTEEHPDDETFPGLLVLRTEGSMTFASAPRLRELIAPLIESTSPRVIVFDFSGVPILEYTAFKMLTQFEETHRNAGTEVWLAGLTPGVLELIRRTPLGRTLGNERLFFNVHLAVEAYQSRSLRRPTGSGL